MAAGLEDHPAQARVQREMSEFRAGVGQPEAARGAGDRAQLLQQRDAVGHVPGVGRVDEREVLDLAEVQVGHPQDDRGQAGPQDLRLGELGPAVEVGLAVEPDADAVRGAAAPARALAGRGLGDGLDGQPLDLGPVAVARDPRGAGVDDVGDAGDGQRGLGDVGGQHDAAAAVGLEDAVLLGGGQPAVQGQDLQRGRAAGAAPAARLLLRVQGVGRVADLALAAEEDQDVAGAGGAQLVDRVGDALDLVARLGTGVVGVGQRPVADLDRVGPARYLDDRGLTEVSAEPLGVDGGRGDDDLEVRPGRQQPAQVAEDEVDVQAALVRLVDDQRVVAQQPRGRAASRSAGCRRS